MINVEESYDQVFGDRNPNIHSLFHVADINDDAIGWIGGDTAGHILHTIDGLFDSLNCGS